MMTEPHFSQARADVDLVANADAAIAPVFISGVYFAATSWVNDHPDVARRVAQALRETARWANTHHAETAVVLARASSLDAATISRMTRSTYAESLTVPAIAPALDVAYAYGRLKEPSTSVDWSRKRSPIGASSRRVYAIDCTQLTGRFARKRPPFERCPGSARPKISSASAAHATSLSRSSPVEIPISSHMNAKSSVVMFPGHP